MINSPNDMFRIDINFRRSDLKNQTKIVFLQISLYETERENVLKRSEAEREAAETEQNRAETYLV